MKNHYALIFRNTNVVENIIVADDTFVPPDGRDLVALPSRPEIGWIYDRNTGIFMEPAETTTPIGVSLLPSDVTDLIAILSEADADPARILQLKQKIGVIRSGE